jgi:phosphoserine phosphatase
MPVRAGRISTVVLDVDSTLCGIEGIDWLATRRGAETSARVRELTDRAMRGEIPLESVYGERLSLVHPTADDVRALAREYAAQLAPGARSAVQRLLVARRRVLLVSGGIREAILPMAIQLGIHERDVHAVSVRLDGDGRYAGFDADSPLTTAGGKRTVLQSVELRPTILAMGDGSTDLAMRAAVDVFAAYTGFVFRESIATEADMIFDSFDQLTDYVLP